MPVINKGIAKAVRDEFIKGVHDESAMLVQLAHLNTDTHRRAYIINLTKALREKHGLQTKRDKRFGSKQKRKKTVKPRSIDVAERIKQFTDIANSFELPKADRTYDDPPRMFTGFHGDGDVTAFEHSIGFVPKSATELQSAVWELQDKNDELKQEIARLNVIITYLEGRIK